MASPLPFEWGEHKIKVGKDAFKWKQRGITKKICSIRKEDIRKKNLGFCEIIGTKLVNSGMSFCIRFWFNYDYYDYI